MVTAFFRKLASQVKSKRKQLPFRIVWARPNLEALDPRVLPSVNTTLKGGILKIIADANHGTAQVEIIQSQGQLTVEDTGTVVNSFDPSQIQQIDFKYRELQHQHTKFDLTIPVDQSQMTLTGFAVGEVDLTLGGNSLTATAAATLPDGTAVNLAGPVSNQGNYDLTGTADVVVDGFSLPGTSFELTNTSLTATGAMTLVGNTIPLSGPVDNQGNYDLTGTANVTVGTFSLPGVAFELTSTSLSAATALTLDGTTIALAGTVDNQGNYDLTGAADVTVAGFSLNAAFVLTNTNLTAAASVNVGSDQVNLAGTVDNQGNYELAGTAQITVAGFGINAAFVLTNTNLTAAASVTVGSNQVNLAGTVNNQGQYNLTGTAQITVAGFSLNAGFTLTNTNLAAAGTVSVGGVNVSLAGTVNNQGQYNLTGTADVVVAGFTLHAGFILTNTNMSVAAHATGIPLVGSVDFSGTVNASGYTLSATATNVDLLGFIHFNTIALTLTNTNLSLSAATTLPVVGDVTFTGNINASGSFTISATAPSFTLLGFLTFTNATVSLSFPNPTLTVSASINLPNVGNVTFMGSITAGGHFSFTAHASLTVAGFTLGTANLSISDAPASCITIGPFTTLPLPVIGPVTIQGMYCAGGMFSFDADIMPSPPLVIGGIPFNRFHFGLSNTSLTFGAGVGISFGGLNIASAYFQGTIHTNGDFQFLAQVNAFSILGFNAVMGTLTFTETAGNFSLTLHASAQLLVATVIVDGSLDVNHGQFSLTGTANVSLAGFPVGAAAFTLNNNGVVFAVRINVIVATVNFVGSVASNGAFRLAGNASVGFAGFGGSGSFTLTNSGLTFSGSVNVIVATINVTGAVSNTGAFFFGVNTRMSFAGFAASGSLTLNNGGVTVSALLDLGVLGVRMSFGGAVHSNGTFIFTAHANLTPGPFTFGLDLTLTNTGFSAHVHAALDVSTNVGTSFWSVHVGFRGSIDVNFAINTSGAFSATGNLQMCAYAGVSLCVGIGFSADNHQFCVKTSDIGFSISGIHFKPFGDTCFRY